VKLFVKNVGESSVAVYEGEGPTSGSGQINPLNARLNPICYLLALGAHHNLHVGRIRVNALAVDKG
jgi:hypothetical protein